MVGFHTSHILPGPVQNLLSKNDSRSPISSRMGDQWRSQALSVEGGKAIVKMGNESRGS